MKRRPKSQALLALLTTSCTRENFTFAKVTEALTEEFDINYDENLYEYLDKPDLLKFVHEWHEGSVRHGANKVPYFQHPLGMFYLAVACKLPKYLIDAALLKSIAQRHVTKSEELTPAAYRLKVQSLNDENLDIVLGELSKINDFARGINMPESKKEHQWKERTGSKLNYLDKLEDDPLLIELISKVENTDADIIDIATSSAIKHGDDFHATMRAYVVKYLKDCRERFEKLRSKFACAPMLLHALDENIEILEGHYPPLYSKVKKEEPVLSEED